MRGAPLLVLVLGGCALLEQLQPGGHRLPPAGGDSCNAAQRSGLIGKRVDALQGVDFDQPVRIVAEGAVVVMQFRPERINFELGRSERIQRIYCG